MRDLVFGIQVKLTVLPEDINTCWTTSLNRNKRMEHLRMSVLSSELPQFLQ